MRKIYSLVSVLCLMAAFILPTSCDNPDVEITKQVTLTVNPATALSTIRGFGNEGNDGTSMFEESKLKIIVLVYDEDGNLVGSPHYTMLSDYTQKCTLTLDDLSIKKQYTVIAMSYAMVGSDAVSPTYEAFTVSGVNDISVLSIKQNYFDTFYSNWSLLGLKESLLNPNSDSVITLNLSPASALLVYQFCDIHAHDSENVDTYRFWFHHNNICKYESGFAYSSNMGESIYSANDVTVSDFDEEAQNIYCLSYVFPTNDMVFFASAYIGTERYDTDESSLTVKAGCTYQFDFDCSDMTIDYAAWTKSADMCRGNDGMLTIDATSAKVTDLLHNIGR